MACASPKQVANAAAIDSKNEVFFATPKSVKVDEDAKTRYSTSLKIDTLIQELKEKGPHVAFGRMGPSCYHSQPFQLRAPIAGKKIYGWKPGTRSDQGQKVYALIIGAKKVEDKGYVYFVLSKDTTQDQKSYTREHQPVDECVYISSNKTFYYHLIDLYPPVAKEKTHPNFISAGSMSCSLQEMPYVLKLVAIPLDSILGDQKAACKKLGQEIFDTFKKENRGDSEAARKAVVGICESMRSCAKDGRLRKQYVEFAWNGIGDNNWRWMC